MSNPPAHKRIAFDGRLEEARELRVGHVGCGGHSFRNLFPLYPLLRMDLVATCDLDLEKAKVYARKFGAPRAYGSLHDMVREEELDAVVVCLGCDAKGRVLHPQVACEAMRAGLDVFIEKPPASDAGGVDLMIQTSRETGKRVLCGLKHMFMPTVAKAKRLMESEDFGEPQMLSIGYPEQIPDAEEFERHEKGERQDRVVRFVDHLCHPVSKLLYLFGMPQRMIFHRTANRGGLATFEYDSGRVASLRLFYGGCKGVSLPNYTDATGSAGRSILIQGTRLLYVRAPAADPGGHRRYGQFANYYTGDPEQAAALWEPETDLGQLYTNGGVVLGYYDELREFSEALLEGRAFSRAHLEHCRQICLIAEKFRLGPGKMIDLGGG